MLRIERDGAIAIWTIDRPDVKNALDAATMLALRDAVRAADADRTIRAAILTGAGDAFVSGGDLRELREKTSAADAETLTDAGWELCEAIGALPFPVVADVNGPAMGGGAELAVACDVRVGHRNAAFGFKQVRLGVTASWGTVPRLVALVGAGQAARLLYSARTVDAEEARAIGLVDELGGRDAALALAHEIAKGSPAAVEDMKRLVREACTSDLRALERERFVTTWSGADHAEAVEAFFAKRAAVFRDRS